MTELVEREFEVERHPPRSREELLGIVNKIVEREELWRQGIWVGEGQVKPITDIRDVFGPRLSGEQLKALNEEVLHAYMTIEEAHILLGWTRYPYDRLEFMRPLSRREKLFGKMVSGEMTINEACIADGLPPLS